MREILKMMVVLAVICSLSGYLLASLKNVTRDKIQEQVLTYVQGPSLQSLFPGHDNNPVEDHQRIEIKGHDYIVFPFVSRDKFMGIAFESFGAGYSGDIGVMVGFIDNNELAGISITTMTETPGLGTRIAEPGFVDQFVGHSLEVAALNSDNGDIDGVSGATYSSAGAIIAVQKAITLYPAIRKKMVKKE